MKKLRTLLFLSMLFGLSVTLHAQTTQITPQDSAALVAIYNSTGGPNWTRTWNLTQPANTWAGVDINGQGRVNALVLPDNNLVGDLAPDISALDQLQVINFRGNQLTSLPDLTGLNNVGSFDIRDNQLDFNSVVPAINSFPGVNNVFYAPQDSFGTRVRMSAVSGDIVIMIVPEDAGGESTLWFKRPNANAPFRRGDSMIIRGAEVPDSGQYYAALSNSKAPLLTLFRRANILTVSPASQSHESARDSTGQLRAILRIPPGNPKTQEVIDTLEALGATRIPGEGCLCDEFTMWYFPDTMITGGEIKVGAASIIASACEEGEAVGGEDVQLGYDYLLDGFQPDATTDFLNIRMNSALDMTGLNPVKVAVIDLGIDSTHQALHSYLYGDDSQISCMTDPMGYNFYLDNANPFDVSSSHGTHVAGIISDFIPDLPVQLMSVQVGSAENDARVFDIACGIRYATLQKVDLINMSMGYSGPKSELLEDVVKEMVKTPTQMVAAAGNNNKELDFEPFWPANFSKEPAYSLHVVSVASMDKDYLAKASFSNFGIPQIGVAAPGEAIRSTMNGNTYGNMSGTSMAAPFVTAVMAYLKAKFPGDAPANLKDRLIGDPTYSTANPSLAGMVTGNMMLNIAVDDCKDVPRARNDAYVTPADQPLTFDVRNNDCPATGLTPALVGPGLDPAQGEVNINPDGSMTFTPASGYDGAISFTYQLCSASAVCSEASVSIAVGEDGGNYWWWIILILIIMFILAYFVLSKNP